LNPDLSGCTPTPSSAWRPARGAYSRRGPAAAAPVRRRAAARAAAGGGRGAGGQPGPARPLPGDPRRRPCARRRPLAGMARTACPPSMPRRQVLPVNGTREALFAIAQTCVGHGAAPWSAPQPVLPDLRGRGAPRRRRPCSWTRRPSRASCPDPDALLERAQWQALELLYLCTPGNPAGAVMDEELLGRFIEKALPTMWCWSATSATRRSTPTRTRRRRGCWRLPRPGPRRLPQLHQHALPVEALEPARPALRLRRRRRAHPRRLPALPQLPRLRHAAASPGRQHAVAWSDEEHVIENRERYREKFAP
jgi:N-succinyldiaminopimelate aminotransferase